MKPFNLEAARDRGEPIMFGDGTPCIFCGVSPDGTRFSVWWKPSNQDTYVCSVRNINGCVDHGDTVTARNIVMAPRKVVKWALINPYQVHGWQTEEEAKSALRREHDEVVRLEWEE